MRKTSLYPIAIASCLPLVARLFFALSFLALPFLAAASSAPAPESAWDRPRIEKAFRLLDEQKSQGILSDALYRKKREMLEARLKGSFKPTALSTKPDGEINLIQNAGFEEVNRNSEKNRSRWLWWGGWSWGGDYENFWAEPPNVHSGKYAAGIRCTGKAGRIGISTPKLPILAGTKELVLTFWAKGEGENQIFINFESGATGDLRTKIAPEWKQYTVKGTPEAGAKEFTLYIYSIGGGTLYIDDVKLAPVGALVE
jgi:hypothetical protein